MTIDPRAIVDPSAKLGANVTVGPWTIVGPDVELGDNTEVASHVVLKGPTKIGKNNKIYSFSSVGEDTPAFAYQGEPTTLVIGDGNVIREGVTIHRGMVSGIGTTIIGNNCLLMPYVHVGHDCELGDHIIMANFAGVAGHVKVGDHANFGGYAAVPQYRNVGAYTHITGAALVTKDVPAYMTVSGNPAVAVGLNLEGMKRRGYDKTQIDALKLAHKVVYRQQRTVKDALVELEPLAAQHPEVAEFVASIKASDLGIVRPRSS